MAAVFGRKGVTYANAEVKNKTLPRLFDWIKIIGREFLRDRL